MGEIERAGVLERETRKKDREEGEKKRRKKERERERRVGGKKEVDGSLEIR